MVIKVGIDQAANLKVLRNLQHQGLIELRQANELEQTWSDVVQQKKGFMLGSSMLNGPDVLADDKVHEVEAIIGLDKRTDIAHIYAAYLNKCEYFVTENVKDFINGGRREALESLLGVKIRRTEEFLREVEGLTGSRCSTVPYPLATQIPVSAPYRSEPLTSEHPSDVDPFDTDATGAAMF